MLLEIGLAVLAVLVLWQWRSYRQRRSMPPGDWGWPVIGRIPSNQRPLVTNIPALRKQYGDTFTWKIGARSIVVLCDFQTIKQAYNRPEFQDRPDFLSNEIMKDGKNLGLFNSNGEVWQKGRRFSIHHLRDMGMGRAVLEDAVATEARHLLDDLLNYTDRPTVVPMSLNLAIVNIMWKVTSDQRLELNDPMNQAFQERICNIFKGNQSNVMLFDFFPYLTPFTPKFVFKWLGVTEYAEDSKALLDFIHVVVKEHIASLDPNNPRDFIDAFLLEKAKEKNQGNDAFSEKNLVVSVSDVFLASSETTSATIRWILLYLAKYPEVQAKIQAELDEAVPRDRLPGLQDKDKLNYTQAALHEAERLVSFTPFTAVHCSTTDTQIDGYHVPKDTVVVAHVQGCHTDPKYWEKPDQFYPEHFLDQDGKFKLKTVGFAPFSIGRRVCPGASLSRMVMFMFCSALLQTYTFSAPEGVTLSTDRFQNERLFNVAPPTEFIIKKRA